LCSDAICQQQHALVLAGPSTITRHRFEQPMCVGSNVLITSNISFNIVMFVPGALLLGLQLLTFCLTFYNLQNFERSFWFKIICNVFDDDRYIYEQQISFLDAILLGIDST